MWTRLRQERKEILHLHVWKRLNLSNKAPLSKINLEMTPNKAKSIVLLATKILPRINLWSQRNNQFQKVMSLKGLFKNKVKDSSILKTRNKDRMERVTTIQTRLLQDSLRKNTKLIIFIQRKMQKCKKAQILRLLMKTGLEWSHKNSNESTSSSWKRLQPIKIKRLSQR